MSNWFPIFLLPFVTLGIPLAWAVTELVRTPRGTGNWAVLSRDGVRPHTETAYGRFPESAVLHNDVARASPTSL
jgi:hypothetical protein